MKDITSDEQWLADLKAKNRHDLSAGIASGWWEDVDEKSGLPIKVFKLADFHEHATWAHVFTKGVSKFPSMKEAKRAGFGMPLTCETKRIGTYIVRVEE